MLPGTRRLVRFQSTPSSRKVTGCRPVLCRSHKISIHTFLAEGDYSSYIGLDAPIISIHTFLAEGDQIALSQKLMEKFQSTPSSRKVTFGMLESLIIQSISIHTFLAEGDEGVRVDVQGLCISIHTFLAEGDSKNKQFYISSIVK